MFFGGRKQQFFGENIFFRGKIHSSFKMGKHFYEDTHRRTISAIDCKKKFGYTFAFWGEQMLCFWGEILFCFVLFVLFIENYDYTYCVRALKVRWNYDGDNIIFS